MPEKATAFQIRRIYSANTLMTWIFNTEFYIDDGFSGVNFERPAFKRMLEDVENGKIETVITKDLSRFGRNHLYVGLYTEEIFPKIMFDILP